MVQESAKDLHIGDLSPFTPDDLTAGRNKTKLGDVDLNNCTLGQNTELGVQRVLGVLLNGQNGQLDSDTEFGAVDRY